MRTIRILLLLLTALPVVSPAQQFRPAPSAGIYHKISGLNKLVRVLYLAAHPDDENTRLLAWLVNEQHIPTAYLSLTRGDGGQNILSDELGPALGLIRTHELIEARKLDGAGQFFTRAIDFGFSKNPEETFKHWDKQLLTGDVVRIIRQYRPDVIICRFPPDARGGHGQHSASAILAREAFLKAGDPNSYPEQLKSLQPWQPKRLLWNTYRFGNRNTTSEDQYKTEVGQYSPLLGMGYGELAGISRSIHRSQGAGTPSIPGVQKEYFDLVEGGKPVHSLFDGIETSWKRVQQPGIGKDIDRILNAYDFTQPQKSLPDLLRLRSKIAGVQDAFWRGQKLRALDEIILDAMGFMAEATTSVPQTTPGSTVPYTLRFVVRAGMPLRVSMNGTESAGEGFSISNPVSDSLYALERQYRIPEAQPYTQPYWLMQPPVGAHFSIPHDSLLGLPQTPNSLVVQLSVETGMERFQLNVPLSYKKLDPVRGDVVEQLPVVPAVSVTPFEQLLLTRPDGSLRSSVKLTAFEDIASGRLRIRSGSRTLMELPPVSLSKGTDTSIEFELNAAQLGERADMTLTAEFIAAGKTYDQSLRQIRYSHLPNLQYFSPATAQVLRHDWKVQARRIGYIEGAGDFTASLLRMAGLDVTVLKAGELLQASALKEYDAIITGIRALNTQKDLRYRMPVLLEYARNGGTLILQYNTLQELSTKEFAPYDIHISAKRVTEEDARVTMLQPGHPLWNSPNRITPEDFNGWVQERALYMPDNWNGRYQHLLLMSDQGEDPQGGALLYTPYGKGHYIYTSLAFFRQLPAGNKGAIKILMNLISAGK